MKNTKSRKSVAIIDYGMGNINSVKKMVELLNYNPYFVSDREGLDEANYIILPGVGSFSRAYNNLLSLGLLDSLNENVILKKKPFLGICLGMQLLSESGEEGGVSPGLGWVEGVTRKMRLTQDFNVPHMGWDTISIKDRNNLFKDIYGTSPELYFCHSYVLEVEDPDIVIADFSYQNKYVAAIKKENIYGTQFHPEKSQEYGKICFENFLRGN